MGRQGEMGYGLPTDTDNRQQTDNRQLITVN